MKIISHFNAVTTLSAPWDEIRPLTGAAFPLTLQVIKDRYKFQAAGQSAISQQIGLITPSFQTGEFKIGDQVAPLNQLEFQPQSVIVSCATTDQTYKVIDDLFAFLQQTLAFRFPQKERKRHHSTIIIVDFGTSLDPLFDNWSKVHTALNAMLESGPELIPFGMRFGAVNNEGHFIPERQYVIERRAVTPPGENWIFSQAPLDTDGHVKLLSVIEAALSD